MAAKPTKIQRWIDLLAALLVRNFPATLEELVRDIPGYQNTRASRAALLRMFERDKDELRKFGVPIETTLVETNDGPCSAYRLARRDFYLPYLCVVSPDGTRTRPRRVDRFGYQALTTLVFEPDELAALAEAIARIRSLGEPLLEADVESAARKLALDLPIDGVSSDIIPLAESPRPQPAVFETLNDALARRKTVRFHYHAMHADRPDVRSVEPYGLFFLSTHWYLAARDHSRGELRTFRLSRITSPVVNPKRSQTPDYDIPATFSLQDYARSRHPWELGEGEMLTAVVAFTPETGAGAAAFRLGTPVPGRADCRSFQVRRVDAFARWLLSFAGEAVPVDPPALVHLYQEQIRRTLAVYGSSGDSRATTEHAAIV